MNSFIGVYDGIASDDYCDRMVDSLNHLLEVDSVNNDCGEVANGGEVNRRDQSRYFQRDDIGLAAETNNVLNQALAKYQEEYPSISMQQFYSHVVKVQKTPPKGGFHSWHCEQGSGSDSVTRVLVWMIYLSDAPEGEGTTEFLEYGIKLQPKKGTVVFFPSSWTHTHRGNPVYSCDKYIATGWYYLN